MSVRTRATIRGVLAGLGWSFGVYVVLCVIGVFVGIGTCATAPPQFIAFYVAFMFLAISLGAAYFAKKAYRGRMDKK